MSTAPTSRWRYSPPRLSPASYGSGARPEHPVHSVVGSQLVVVVAMADRPELKGDHSDQQGAEGDERGQPTSRVGHDQHDHHDGVGNEQEARQDRAYCRPAGQACSASRFIVVSGRRWASLRFVTGLRLSDLCRGHYHEAIRLIWLVRANQPAVRCTVPCRYPPMRVFPLDADG